MEKKGTFELNPPKPGTSELKKTLGPLMLWGLGVGYVISGMYFGWNLGLPEGGPLGLLVATIFVTIMYVTFVISYAELSCAIPKAGGAFVYGNRALGAPMGFLAGMAQLVEFVFAPPAIAIAIGTYFTSFMYFKDANVIFVAMVAYLIFTALNIYGVQISAVFELVVTVLAVCELLLFTGVTAPHFSMEAFSSNPLPNGWWGAFAAIPFAIWFYLAIEGIANVAEETINPQKDMIVGFTSAMGTLVILALLVFFSSVGVNGWETVVYEDVPVKVEQSTSMSGNEVSMQPKESMGDISELKERPMSDKPLPLALAHVVGKDSIYYRILLVVGIFGLIASFHGIILVAGRATLAFGRVGYAPAFLGKTLKGRQTPAAALIVNMLVGFLAIMTGKTGEIITIAVFGALTLYIISMISLFELRKTEPNLPRPYKVPLYPIIPIIALSTALVCMAAVAYFNQMLFTFYIGILVLGYLWFFLVVPPEVRAKKID